MHEWKMREVHDVKFIDLKTGETVLELNTLPCITITNLPSLASVQVSIIRTLWELAQKRIDDIYSEEGAEIEKQAFEHWMEIALPFNYKDIVRA